MQQSRRYSLPEYDYDENLVDAQMTQKFVEGIGFCGWKEDAILNPSDILRTRRGEISKRINEEHKACLDRKKKPR